LEETEAAGKEFESAIKEDPASVPLLIDYAKFLADTGRIAEAMQSLHGLVTEKPELVAVWLCGGRILLAQPDVLDVALDWTSVAVQHLPDDPEILELHAETLLLAGQIEQALPLWRKLESTSKATVLSAIVLCEAALKVSGYKPPIHLVGAIDQEFTRWFRRLVEFKAEAALVQVLDQTESLARLLPTSGNILKEIIKEFKVPSATSPSG
jgi:predicted Zn-dependent protease